MGATATQALLDNGDNLLARRGQIEITRTGVPVLITLHPAYVLRVPDPSIAMQAKAHFLSDLQKAQGYLDNS